MSTESKRPVEVLTYETAREQGGSDCLSNDKRVAEDGEEFVSGADYAAIVTERDALVVELRNVAFEGNRQFIAWEETKRERDALSSRLAEAERRVELLMYWLGVMWDKYENGDDCYEEPDEFRGFLGKAFRLNQQEEDAILSALYKVQP